MMRVFTGPDGRLWDVVPGRESWGVVVALFVSREGGETRRATLQAESSEGGAAELEALDERGLDALFRRSEPTP
jgi:hypothetical protein